MSATATDTVGPPAWAVELFDIFALRRRVLIAVAAGISVLGIALTMGAPGLLPSTAVVGAAVAIAAILVALAAAIAVDAGDLVVRGPRHVRAAGARVAGVVPASTTAEALAPVADAVDAHLERAGTARLSITSVAGVRSSLAWTEGLARGLSARGRRVLLIDATQGTPGERGFLSVARGESKLGPVVDFDPELMLARVGAGGPLEAALLQLPVVLDRLPADIEVTLIATPPVVDPGVLPAVASAGSALLLAEIDTTSRVDLLAALDSLDGSSTRTEVVLIDPRASAAPPRRGGGELVGPADAPSDGPPAESPPAEPTSRDEGPTVPAPPSDDSEVAGPTRDALVGEPAGSVGSSADGDETRADGGRREPSASLDLDTQPIQPIQPLAPLRRSVPTSAEASIEVEASSSALLVEERPRASHLDSVAAAQTLAQEIWSRDGSPGGDGPAAG